MTPTSFVRLAAATAIAVVAAVASVQFSRANYSAAERGESFLPNFVSKVNSISSIAVQDGDWKIDINKVGDKFVEASTGYPVRIDAVRDFVSSLAVLGIEERKTDKPDRYAELELATADAADGAGKRLLLKGGDAIIADIVVGQRDFTVGGARGGVFARHADKPPAYLLRGDVTMPGTRAGWFETQLLKIATQSIQSATLTPPQGDSVQVVKSKSSGALVLDNLPDGESADAAQVGRIGQLLSTLSFEDVRKAGEKSAGKTAELAATTDKMRISIKPVAAKMDPDETWVSVAFKPQALSETSATNKLSARVDGYEFKVKRYDAETLALQLPDMLNKKAPAQNSAAQPSVPGLSGLPGAPGAPPQMLQLPKN